MHKMKNSLLFIFLIVTMLLAACSQQDKKPLRTGDKLSSFTAQTIDKQSFKLSSYAGRPMVVRFFLTNCPFCKADTPTFNSFYSAHKDSGLMVVYLNTNASNLEEVETFSREFDIQFPVIYDMEGKIAKQYNIKAQPLTLVLSPEHKLLAALLGGVSREELDELLGKYLN